MIRVVSHQRGKIESHGEAGLSLREQVTVARVAVFGGAEAGELAHGPQPAAVHGGVDSARQGRLTRERQVATLLPAGKLGGRVHATDGMSGDRGELRRAFGEFVRRGLVRALAHGCAMRERIYDGATADCVRSASTSAVFQSLELYHFRTLPSGAISAVVIECVICPSSSLRKRLK